MSNERATWPLQAPNSRVRRAEKNDIDAIVALLADDPLGAKRESRDPASYEAAFSAIDRDPNQLLVVVEDRADARVVGTCQLTFTPGMSRGGALRVTIEALRIARSARGRGIGEELLGWAVDRARERGASLVQLTTDVTRIDALRFYERLGFVASHHGLKLQL